MGQFKSMTKERFIQIGELARISGISIRTLHYYEEIGLLVPGRSTKDYRLYSPEDVMRLQQILIQKAMGLSLEQIKSALDDPEFNYLNSLRQQKHALEAEITRFAKMINSIDAAIADLKKKDDTMPDADLFDGFDPEIFNAEVEQKWGHTDAYLTSAQRSASFEDSDWREMKQEQDQIWSDAAQFMAQGQLPDSEVGLEMAERHRAHIHQWFYPCSREMHVKLSEMWLADQRFKDNIDKFAAGLTDWFVDAIRANQLSV